MLFLRKKKKHHHSKSHYMFYRYNTDGGYGYCLTDYDSNKVYTARHPEGETEYIFRNEKTNKERRRTISPVQKTENGYQYFLYGDKKITDVLRAKGLGYRMTVVSQTQTRFRIYCENEQIAVAIKEMHHDGSVVFRVTKYDTSASSLDDLFLVLFTVARLDL